jgi:hypothetical protein
MLDPSRRNYGAPSTALGVSGADETDSSFHPKQTSLGTGASLKRQKGGANEVSLDGSEAAFAALGPHALDRFWINLNLATTGIRSRWRHCRPSSG